VIPDHCTTFISTMNRAALSMIRSAAGIRQFPITKRSLPFAARARSYHFLPLPPSESIQAQNQNLKKNRVPGYHRLLSTSDGTSKVVGSAREALSDCVFPGASINIGGFGLGGIPETLLNELAKDDRARDLTVASLTAGVDGFGLGKLFEAGKVKRMIASYVGENQVRKATTMVIFHEYLRILTEHCLTLFW